jgi:hypothetical protein
LFKVEEENEEEDIIEDTNADTISAGPAHTMEATVVEDASMQGSGDEMM